MTPVILGDLASAIAVTVLEENDRNLFYFKIWNFQLKFALAAINNIDVTGTMEVQWRSLRSPLNFWRYHISHLAILYQNQMTSFHFKIISNHPIHLCRHWPDMTKGWNLVPSKIILSIKEAADEAEEEVESKSEDGASDAKVDFEVIDALLDVIDLDE